MTAASSRLLFSRSVVSDACDPMDCSPPGSPVHGRRLLFLYLIAEPPEEPPSYLVNR